MMVKLTTAAVGDKVRVRVGRRWVEATVLQVGEGFGGRPVARLDVRTRWTDTRCEPICALRPAVSQI
jgi:hypothetical protein